MNSQTKCHHRTLTNTYYLDEKLSCIQLKANFFFMKQRVAKNTYFEKKSFNHYSYGTFKETKIKLIAAISARI